MSDQQSVHWFAVGKVSDLAQAEVIRTGGRVVQLHDEPDAVLVGIAYANPDDLTIINTSEIEIATLGLHLVWMSKERLINAAFCSIHETELLTHLEYEARLMDVPLADVLNDTSSDADAPTFFDGLEDLEDHPF